MDARSSNFLMPQKTWYIPFVIGALWRRVLTCLETWRKYDFRELFDSAVARLTAEFPTTLDEWRVSLLNTRRPWRNTAPCHPATLPRGWLTFSNNNDSMQGLPSKSYPGTVKSGAITCQYHVTFEVLRPPLLAKTMSYHKWPPGPLLMPPARLDLAQSLCSLKCTCRWPDSERLDLESNVCTVSVLKDGIVLSNAKCRPLLMKRYIFMDNNRRFTTQYWGGESAESAIVTLPRRMNVIDDYDIDIKFKSVAEFHIFSAAVASCPSPNPQLGTNIYVLSSESSDEDSSNDSASSNDESTDSGSNHAPYSRTAKLLQPHPLHIVINEVLTSLAYGDGGQLLGPVISWDASSKGNPKKSITMIQDRFQGRTPPLILILDGGASFTQSPIPDSILWDDEQTMALTPLKILPSQPTWGGESPAPVNWVSAPVQNYGLHERKDAEPNFSFLALSHDLVDYFAAAYAACVEAGSPDERAAKRSFEAATASIKTTLIHELTHLWVSSVCDSSPPRQRVHGAEDSSFDCTEDPLDPGQIEAGLLVQRCWLGAPHELTLNQEGWLAFALLETPSETLPDALSEEASFDTPAIAPAEGPLSPGLGSPIKLKDWLQAPSRLSDGDSSSEEGDSLSNSPVEVHSKSTHGDSLIHIRLCDPAVVAEFAGNSLPRFRQSELTATSTSIPVSPLRNRNRVKATPSPVTRPKTPPSTPLTDPAAYALPRLILGSRPAVALRGKGPKWPPVLYRSGHADCSRDAHAS
ncbi:hypothetical protein K438DRAFT_316350 [Mycena galopus ATCC 62051]|nr:hypothetical protein K438DRAFT_316350 [Mycena galopus ATCC 62051]